MATSDQGFANMDEQKRTDIASKGGKAQGAQNNPGNFANDKHKAAQAGRKSGRARRTIGG